MLAVSQVGISASASCAALATPRPVSSSSLADVGRVALERRLVDEQEAEHVHGLGEGGHPLVHQRGGPLEQRLLLVAHLGRAARRRAWR